MSRVVDFYIRTDQPVDRLERDYRAQLRAAGADPDRFWLHFRAADAEAKERGRREFGFEPAVVASVQPPPQIGDPELQTAFLMTAHAAGAELVAFHDGTPLFSYRGGAAQLPAQDRAYYEAYVLPAFAGRIEWKDVWPP